MLTVEGDGWTARNEILNEINTREGLGDAVGYDHLSYVCVHCCAAIEPEGSTRPRSRCRARSTTRIPSADTVRECTCGLWTPG